MEDKDSPCLKPSRPRICIHSMRYVSCACGSTIRTTAVNWCSARTWTGTRMSFPLLSIPRVHSPSSNWRPHPFVYLKPCLRTTSGLLWATGANRLVVATREDIRDIYPSFHSPEQGSILDVITLESTILNRQHSLRVYLPAGYEENTCRTFPVIYMQDGRNLFFPLEAFLGQDWGVEDKLVLLNGMNAIEQMIVVGIFSADRMQEYTKPGYETYGRSVVEEIKPYIDSRFRTRPGRRSTGVMGSSLGGVVSFYMGWQWPEVFGGVG